MVRIKGKRETGMARREMAKVRSGLNPRVCPHTWAMVK
jgi:hypothetical protein